MTKDEDIFERFSLLCGARLFAQHKFVIGTNKKQNPHSAAHLNAKKMFGNINAKLS